MQHINLRSLLVALTAGLLAAAGFAQPITTARAAQSDKINQEIHKLDLLVKLEPLAFRKDQYPDLLDGIEKARDIEKTELDYEDDVLSKLEPEVTTAIDGAVEKGEYPPHDTQADIARELSEVQSRRIKTGVDMVHAVWTAIQTKLNDGQRKAMANSFTAAMIDPSLKPDALTDDIKIRFFVQTVLLDPLAYDLLVEMSKHAS